MKQQWYIGCSGFHYKEWKDIFYPGNLPQRRWFEYYSSVFHTLELNVTFYRFPRLDFLQRWFTNSPDHFRFAVKAPRLITHYKQFKECSSLLSDFYGTIREGLAGKLGPVLFQLPPSLNNDPASLERIITSLDSSFCNVLEFRTAGWWNKQVFKKLRAQQIVFSGISYPGLPADAIVTGETAYYRFHGIPRLYYSAYRQKDLYAVADTLLHNKVKEVYVFFNNTATAAAIRNARNLSRYIQRQLK